MSYRSIDLEVDKIRDVTWNQQAFSTLVAYEHMKDLILALVTNQLSAKTSTDVIENKGNGLIMLLHGPPGTGKTFTAECVAEIAKKPIYSVTCGDIGTEPEAVEKYLESVFHLGKIWDCVVLLDEAVVFLEQPGAPDRKQIWRNFFRRLQKLGEQDSVDFDDITLHMNELVGYSMNGRQIRNSITTGRQLAKHKKKKMTFEDLEKAIIVAQKFDKYLADVREADVEEAEDRGEDGRYSDEYFARADQIR
ncbi:putative aaa family atpase protein [Eutypa lata UCREL1]|uniref:Putative aaa family atpase protein n=1 Tax=Eutypa lata (strain UCR-EL1) TaxID=1287681 RepID=M7TZY2_EUTLA|nr:putative aaa family atpase protein [Eutypa lata UCREL1]